MSTEKQIEEMARDMYALLPDYDVNERDCRYAAKEMFAKGYRKQSKEVGAAMGKNYTDAPDWVPQNYIRGRLPQEELLVQLAEEAAELAQAALKLRRATDGTNPTPTPQSRAFEDLLEEVADVALLVELLHLDQYSGNIRGIMDHKTLRWQARLKEREDKKKCTN